MKLIKIFSRKCQWYRANKFPSHIICDTESSSEIVIPIEKNSKLIGVLDSDSTPFSRFDNSDKLYLEKLIKKVVDIL